MAEFFLNATTRTIHRDLGCSRLNHTPPENITILRHDLGYRRCSYCYSAAGYRRYPVSS